MVFHVIVYNKSPFLLLKRLIYINAGISKVQHFSKTEERNTQKSKVQHYVQQKLPISTSAEMGNCKICMNGHG